MQQRLTILHVVAPGAVGGLESVVRLLAAGHSGRGHSVHVAVVVEGDAAEGDGAVAPFIDALRQADVSVASIRLRPRGYLQERSAIAGLCRRIRPDVVHTHGYRPDVVDSAVARRLGLPTLTTAHGETGGDLKNRVYEWVQRRAFRRFDAVVAVSRPLVERIAAAGVQRERIHLIPNAYEPHAPPLGRVEARRLLGARDGTFLVGWVGRLSPEKGADVLIEAMSRLPRDVDVRAAVIGDGAERPRLAAMLGAPAVDGRVTLHGILPDASRLFPAFDLFALSSRTEGTPVVLFEAMAAEVPVVTTSVGGVPDVVSPSEAMLVPTEDPRALAEAILAVLRDSEGARARARAAHDRLRADYSLAPWLATYERLYLSVRRLPRVTI